MFLHIASAELTFTHQRLNRGFQLATVDDRHQVVRFEPTARYPEEFVVDHRIQIIDYGSGRTAG